LLLYRIFYVLSLPERSQDLGFRTACCARIERKRKSEASDDAEMAIISTATSTQYVHGDDHTGDTSDVDLV
jgi:hypothetical protein